jgi:hypothetical protein
MGFVKVPGLPGRVYVPDPAPQDRKKHPCKDCFCCEFCSDDRCRVCRRGKGDCHRSGECGIGNGDTITEDNRKR